MANYVTSGAPIGRKHAHICLNNKPPSSLFPSYHDNASIILVQKSGSQIEGVMKLTGVCDLESKILSFVFCMHVR
jgi:hypothetical protein